MNAHIEIMILLFYFITLSKIKFLKLIYPTSSRRATGTAAAAKIQLDHHLLYGCRSVVGLIRLWMVSPGIRSPTAADPPLWRIHTLSLKGLAAVALLKQKKMKYAWGRCNNINKVCIFSGEDISANIISE
jgi:hypothetical protein